MTPKAKKLGALLMVLAMALSVFAGCAPEDYELYSALVRTGLAEDYTATETLTWDVELVEPITVTYDEEWGYPDDFAQYVADAQNNTLNVINKLAEDFTIEAVTVKDGNITSMDTRITKPDFMMSFAAWQEAVDGEYRLIYRIPTLVTPFIYHATGDKNYVVMDSAQSNEQAASMTDYIEDFERLGEVLAEELSFRLVTEADLTSESNGGVYTVKFDDDALNGLVNNVLDIISEGEASELMVDIISYFANSNSAITGVEYSREEIEAGYDFAMRNSDLFADAIYQQIENSGLLENGLTARYTLGASGLIHSCEAELVLNVDLEALENAVNEIAAIFEGTGSDSYYSGVVTRGKYNITVNYAVTYDYMATAVELPALTAENSIDYNAELLEYTEYDTAMMELSNSWNYGFDGDGYLETHTAEAPVTIENVENGRSATFEPMWRDNGYSNQLYLPLTELSALFDNVTVVWNPVTMCAELRYKHTSSYDGEVSENTIVIPNENGIAMAEDYEANIYIDENYNTVYGGELLSAEAVSAFENYFNSGYYSSDAYFDENGKCYVNVDTLLWFMDYSTNIEEANVRMQTDAACDVELEEYSNSFEGIEDNFFFLLYGGY